MIRLEGDSSAPQVEQVVSDEVEKLLRSRVGEANINIKVSTEGEVEKKGKDKDIQNLTDALSKPKENIINNPDIGPDGRPSDGNGRVLNRLQVGRGGLNLIQLLGYLRNILLYYGYDPNIPTQNIRNANPALAAEEFFSRNPRRFRELELETRINLMILRTGR